MRDPRYGLLTKRPELDRPGRMRCEGGRRLGALAQHQEQQSPSIQRDCEVGGTLDQLSLGRVGVVQDEQRRALALLRTPDGAEPIRVEDGSAPAQCLAGKLGSQARLADSARSRDEYYGGASLARVGQQRLQLGKLTVPTRQQRGATVQRRRKPLRRRRERRVLDEDRVLQGAQLRAGLQSDLLDQCATRPPVGLERISLPAAAVQGQHQLSVQVLAQRLLGHRSLELGDQVRVAAERELGLRASLERGPAPFLKSSYLRLCEVLVGEVGERRAVPE